MGMTTPFDATSTAMEVVEGIDLSTRTAIVTGGASGIGIETARALAGAGAEVTIAARNLDAARSAVDDIVGTHPGATVHAAYLDLADLDSVDAFVAGWTGPLHVLVANAGVMDTPETYTDRGWELQFATNHMGHFALTLGLHGALASADDARVVVVSSSGHGASPVVFDDLFFDERPYDPGLAYGQSKTANVLFAVELTRRWAGDGIVANALMPGGIWTGLQKHWDPEVKARLAVEAAAIMKTPEQGAATSVLLATSPRLVGVGGRYFEDCREAEVVEEIVDGVHGVKAHALDPDAARRLWEVSTRLLEEAGHPVASR